MSTPKRDILIKQAKRTYNHFKPLYKEALLHRNMVEALRYKEKMDKCVKRVKKLTGTFKIYSVVNVQKTRVSDNNAYRTAQLLNKAYSAQLLDAQFAGTLVKGSKQRFLGVK